MLQKTHVISVKNTTRLMSLWEKIIVYSENYTKQGSNLSGKN